MDQLKDELYDLYVNTMDYFASEGKESLMRDFGDAFEEVYYEERNLNWNDLANLTALRDAMDLIHSSLVPSATRTSANLRKLCDTRLTDGNVHRILTKICKFKVHAGLAFIKTAIKKIKAQKIAAAEHFERMRRNEIEAANSREQAAAIEAAAAQAAAQVASQAAADEAEVRRQAEAAFSPEDVGRYFQLMAERDQMLMAEKQRRHRQGGKKRSHNKSGKKSGKKGGKKSHKKSHKRRH
jgi:hypothetical protein